MLNDHVVFVKRAIWAEVGHAVREQSATAIIRDVSCTQADSSAAQLSLSRFYSIHISHSLPPPEKAAEVNRNIIATAPQFQACLAAVML